MKQGVALENSTSTSQQDLQSYSQQPVPQPPTATSHSPTGHYIYQQPHSPVPPQSPVSISRYSRSFLLSSARFLKQLYPTRISFASFQLMKRGKKRSVGSLKFFRSRKVDRVVFLFSISEYPVGSNDLDRHEG